MSDGDQTPFSIEVQLNVDTSNGDLGEIAYRWLDSVSAALAPEERAELASAPARLGPPGPDVPGEVFGRLDFQHFDADLRNRRRGEWAASTAGLEMLHRELARQCRSATLQLTRVPEPDHAARWVHLKTAILPESPGWLRVYAYVPAALFLDPVEGVDVQRRYREALWSFVEEMNPGFGHIAYMMSAGGPTAYEMCLRNIVTPNPPQWWDHKYTVANCRQFLRGYSWLTIVPAEIAARLGGVDAFTASGAFIEVRELPQGGVWLRATEDFRDFADQEIRRVFTFVAPALRPGPLTNWPRMPHEAPYQLVFEDSATVSRG